MMMKSNFAMLLITQTQHGDGAGAGANEPHKGIGGQSAGKGQLRLRVNHHIVAVAGARGVRGCGQVVGDGSGRLAKG